MSDENWMVCSCTLIVEHMHALFNLHSWRRFMLCNQLVLTEIKVKWGGCFQCREIIILWFTNQKFILLSNIKNDVYMNLLHDCDSGYNNHMWMLQNVIVMYQLKRSLTAGFCGSRASEQNGHLAVHSLDMWGILTDVQYLRTIRYISEYVLDKLLYVIVCWSEHLYTCINM